MPEVLRIALARQTMGNQVQIVPEMVDDCY